MELEPMKAVSGDVTTLERLSDDPRWVAGEKFDGYRELFYIGCNGSGNDLRSSLGTSHISGVPQFQIPVPELKGTIFDCEGMAPTRRLEDNATCFKSCPSTSIQWQQEHGWASLVIFDLLVYKGEVVVSLPFRERRKLLREAFDVLLRRIEHCRLETLISGGKLSYWRHVVECGGEGVILKDLDAPYAPGKRSGAWVKVKRMLRLQYEIMGFMPGTGKYEGLIGSVLYGRDGAVLGSASGMADEVRIAMTRHPEWYVGKMAWFECQSLTDRGVMRHPRYKELAND